MVKKFHYKPGQVLKAPEGWGSQLSALHIGRLYTQDMPLVECVWNLMAHGDAREGKWRGNWRMEWVGSTLTLPRKVVYPALLPLMRTPRLPAVDWIDAPADLNGLVRFGERRNLVSAHVPSHFKRTILISVKGWVGAIVRSQGWSQWKIEPATFRLVAQYLNQRRHV